MTFRFGCLAAAAAFGFLVCGGRAAWGREWFVAKSGSDTNPGARSAPFLSVQRAAAAAMPGDTVVIGAGVYRETVTPARSGIPGRPIVFKPASGAVAVVSGCDPVGGWSVWRGPIRRANVAPALGAGDDQVFEGGRMLPQAQWPAADADPMRPALERAAVGTSATKIVDPKLDQPVGAWVGATVWLLGGNRSYEPWVAQTATVTASAPGSISFAALPNSTADYTPTAGSYFRLIGGPRRNLTSPGEWWMGGAKLYVRLRGGGDPGARDIEIKRRTYAFVLDGRRDIVVEGLSIFAAGISLQGSRDCTVSRCRLRYLSQFSRFANGWDTADTSGIAVSGEGNRIAGCRIEYSAGNGVSLCGDDNTVTDCFIRGCDYSGEDSAGVRAIGSGQTVTHNTITECGRSGILDRSLQQSVIAYNDVSYYGMLTKDLGGAYCFRTDGSGTIIAYNVFHDAVDTLYPDDRFTAGPYLDNGSTHFIVTHNLIYGMAIGIKMNPPSHDNIVVQNTAAGDGSGPSLAGYDTDYTGSTIVDNIFTGSVDPHVGGQIENNLVGDSSPGFVAPELGDYRLASGSPAIGAGRLLSPYTRARPGHAPDDGAYEYGAPAWVAGCDIAPSAPVGVACSPAGSAELVTWRRARGAQRYRVFCRPVGFGPFRQVGETSRLDLRVPGVGASSALTFVVQAVGKGGGGPYSAFASEEPAARPSAGATKRTAR